MTLIVICLANYIFGGTYYNYNDEGIRTVESIEIHVDHSAADPNTEYTMAVIYLAGASHYTLALETNGVRNRGATFIYTQLLQALTNNLPVQLYYLYDWGFVGEVSGKNFSNKWVRGVRIIN